MIEAREPSGQFGIWREPDGGFRLEFYRPDGLLTSRTVFDAEAAREFRAAVAETILPTADSRGEGPCMDCGTLDTPVWSAPNDLWNRVVGSSDGYLCPWCFAVRAESAIGPRIWDFAPRGAVMDDK